MCNPSPPSSVLSHLASVSYIQPYNSPPPPLSVIEARIRRAYHPTEAAPLLSFVSRFQGNETEYWQVVCPFQPASSKKPMALDKGFSSHLALLARAEVEELAVVRMRVREKKKKLKWMKGRTQVFDENNGVVGALEMVEALPQGSRGVHPPHEGFLKLGRRVAGEMADGERQVAYGLLLEEYALELLAPYTTSKGEGSTGDAMSAYAVPPTGVRLAKEQEERGDETRGDETSGAKKRKTVDYHSMELTGDLRYGVLTGLPDIERVRVVQEELGVALQKRGNTYFSK